MWMVWVEEKLLLWKNYKLFGWSNYVPIWNQLKSDSRSPHHEIKKNTTKRITVSMMIHFTMHHSPTVQEVQALLPHRAFAQNANPNKAYETYPLSLYPLNNYTIPLYFHPSGKNQKQDVRCYENYTMWQHQLLKKKLLQLPPIWLFRFLTVETLHRS